MGNFLKQQWKQIRGDAKWDLLSQIWRWWWPVIFAILTTAWGFIEALPGPILLQLFFGGIALGLIIANGIGEWRLRRRWQKGELLLPPPAHVPPQLPEVRPVEDDAPESYIHKHQFRLFVEQEMYRAWYNMTRTMYQVNGQLGERGGAHHYYVRALISFMEPLEEVGKNLDDFLAARDSLSSKDFMDAQKQFARLYRLYEERMCWVRDLVWYTNPNIQTYDYYKNWREADSKMREELKTLLPQYSVLSEQIPQPSSIDPWWWEKTPSS